MLDWLLELDKKAFLFLNGFNSHMWDNIMYWCSGALSWIPLYIFFLIIIVFWERPYKFIFTLLFVGIAVLLCDQTSVLIKNLVERPRPTHDPLIADLVHVVKNYRGGQYGFISSHAANCFGVASFLTCWFNCRKWGIFLFSWAAIVAYSRIYLGVHYPLDIICGALLGILIGRQCHINKLWVTAYFEPKIEKWKATRRQKVNTKK